MVPRWKKVPRSCARHGVPVILVDCDGNLDELLPLAVESGINGVLPFEVAAGNDIHAVRRHYGKDLILFGGIDKRALAAGPQAIDRDEPVAKPLLDQGGYFPILDHYAPPDISFANYLYYKRKLKSLRTVD